MKRPQSSLIVGLLVISLLGCTQAQTPIVPGKESPEPLQTEPAVGSETSEPEIRTASTPTSPDPTPTSIPLIAVVNGMEISLAEYQSELAMYKAAVDRELTTEDEQTVLDDLIDQSILAQEAVEKGLAVDQKTLENRLEIIIAEIGGPEKLSEWMRTYDFDEDTFNKTLETSINAALARDELIAAVPDTAEQVHVRQLLFTDENEAEQVLIDLQAGNSFDNLAAEYDPILKGDLGWFPRGYLYYKEIEDAAFKLETGEFSSVIQTPSGYHIIMVIDREPSRKLTQEALIKLQQQELQNWLEARRQNSDIQIISP